MDCDRNSVTNRGGDRSADCALGLGFLLLAPSGLISALTSMSASLSLSAAAVTRGVLLDRGVDTEGYLGAAREAPRGEEGAEVGAGALLAATPDVPSVTCSRLRASLMMADKRRVDLDMPAGSAVSLAAAGAGAGAAAFGEE